MAELNTLLDIPLASSGFVGKYPTKGGELQTAGLQYTSNVGENTGTPGHRAVKDVAKKKKTKTSKTKRAL